MRVIRKHSGGSEKKKRSTGGTSGLCVNSRDAGTGTARRWTGRWPSERAVRASSCTRLHSRNLFCSRSPANAFFTAKGGWRLLPFALGLALDVQRVGAFVGLDILKAALLGADRVQFLVARTPVCSTSDHGGIIRPPVRGGNIACAHPGAVLYGRASGTLGV